MTHRAKVLIVDDSDLVREFVTEALAEHGIDVVALDGPLGFGSALIRERPDLVLMDVAMPALAGDRLVQLARTRSATHECPIVLFSDQPEAHLKRLAAACGAAGWLRKTGDVAELVRAVRKLLQR